MLQDEYFEQEHIPGAANIPLEEIGNEALQRFDREQEIILYCKDSMCKASPKAAEKLEKLGFENVKDYEGGLEAWKNEGHEVEEG